MLFQIAYKQSFFFMLAFLHVFPLVSQTPFTCEGQIFLTTQGTDELVEVRINPANGSIQITPVADLGGAVNSLGFRRTDRLLYGLHPFDHILYRIDANGGMETLANLSLGNGLSFLAGDVSPDGKYLVSIGSQNGEDEMLVKVDLEDVNFSVEIINMTGSTQLTDIAFDPAGNGLQGYDKAGKTMVRINMNNGSVIALDPLAASNDITSVYFDAYSDVYAFGSTAFGVSSALFSIDPISGEETTISSGPVILINDGASCPYSVEVKNSVTPINSFPCSDIVYSFSVANRSGETLTGVAFEFPFPSGFDFTGLTLNSLGGNIDTAALPNVLKIENISLLPGVKNMMVEVEIGDIQGGTYNSQAVLKNLPDYLGTTSSSDNPATINQEDSTLIEVIRFDEDSIFQTRFLCQGETTILDASIFGANIQWYDGSSTQEQVVSQSGVYSLNAVSGCQNIYVSWDVTAASCPFTIGVSHITDPDTLFPCNDAIYRFCLNNDSGEDRQGVTFVDTLPAGFKFVELLRNPYGGIVETDFPSGYLSIKDMNLKMGVDSIELLVSVGNAPPGVYMNRARLINLPPLLGPIRFSDDPRTTQADSTAIVVLGVDTDTSSVEQVICLGEELMLNASQFGESYLWEDGSTGPALQVVEPGIYQVELFDGCEPGLVYFNVTEGVPIYLDIYEPEIKIQLGEARILEPSIINGGDSLQITWTDPQGNTLSCLDCPDPVAFPLESTIYTIEVNNEKCSDSAHIKVLVDDTPRIYTPNVFSPNGDGINDHFFLQSPDFGEIRSLLITNRWGDIVFDSKTSVLNDPLSGWDGFFKGKQAEVGTYTWRAEIEFLEQKRKVLFGNLLILR